MPLLTSADGRYRYNTDDQAIFDSQLGRYFRPTDAAYSELLKLWPDVAPKDGGGTYKYTDELRDGATPWFPVYVDPTNSPFITSTPLSPTTQEAIRMAQNDLLGTGGTTTNVALDPRTMQATFAYRYEPWWWGIENNQDPINSYVTFGTRGSNSGGTGGTGGGIPYIPFDPIRAVQNTPVSPTNQTVGPLVPVGNTRVTNPPYDPGTVGGNIGSPTTGPIIPGVIPGGGIIQTPGTPTPLTPFVPPPPAVIVNPSQPGTGGNQMVRSYAVEYVRSEANANCEIFETVYLVTYESYQDGSNLRIISREKHPVGPNQYTNINLAENPRFIGYDATCLANKAPNSGGGAGGGIPTPGVPGDGGISPVIPGGGAPPTPPTVTGLIYKRFDPMNDIVSDRVHVHTKGAWSDGESSLENFFTSSTQPSSQTDFYIDVYQSGSTDCGSEIQFSVAYGHSEGSGSLATRGNTSISPSKAVYSQYRLLCLEPDDRVFTFSTGSTSVDSKQIYVVSFQRSAMRDKVDPGNWQLTLARLNGDSYTNIQHIGSTIELNTTTPDVITLIDDSSDSQEYYTVQNITEPVYNIVSGTISEGTYANDTGGWGLFYPDLGVCILNADKLDQELAFNSVTASNFDGENPWKLFTSISGSASPAGARTTTYPFVARNGKIITTTYFFANISPNEYNYSNNPTWVSGSLGEFKHKAYEKDPKTYITSIGLYNDRYEMVAVAKLSQPIRKDFFKGTHVTVKLNY